MAAASVVVSLHHMQEATAVALPQWETDMEEVTEPAMVATARHHLTEDMAEWVAAPTHRLHKVCKWVVLRLGLATDTAAATDTAGGPAAESAADEDGCKSWYVVSSACQSIL